MSEEFRKKFEFLRMNIFTPKKMEGRGGGREKGKMGWTARRVAEGKAN